MTARRRARKRGPAPAAGASDARGAESPAARAGWWLAAAALALPPLVVASGAVDPFRLPQRMAAEWLALASLVPLALAGGWGAASPGPRAWRRHPAMLAVAPLLLVASASLATSAHRLHVADALIDLWIGAAVLVGWSAALATPRLRRLLDVVSLGAVPLAAIAVLQLHDLWRPVIFAVDPIGERLEITSLAGNPGDLAAFLVLPALVAQANLRSPGRGRWGWLAVLGLLLYALAATRTLTSLAALVAGSAVLWLLALPPRRAIAGTAGALAALALLLALAPPLRQRVVEQRWQWEIGGMDSLLSGRLDGWRVAARLLRDHPLAGVGHGAFRAEFARTKLAMAAEGETFYTGHLSPSFANVHNEYLEVAADLGWPGLLVLAWGVGVAGVAAGRARRPAGRGPVALAWAGMVGLGVLALAYFPLRLGPVAFSWLALLAWTFSMARAAEEPS
jgi:O-antigen ligase